MKSEASGITEVINAIRILTGVGICYYDLNAFFQYDQYGVKNNRGHYCAFCEKARSLPEGRKNCDQSDRFEAIELAKQYKTPFFHECHMGMRELVIPLIRNDRLLGVLFVGQCRTDSDNDNRIRENALKMNGDPDEFIELYYQLPQISKKDLILIETILSQYFESKIRTSELLIPMSSAPVRNTAELAKSIAIYIRQNYRYKLSTGNIAEAFFVNASYASRRFSERFGITITEYISNIRIEHAKNLLATTRAPIGNIALNVGIDDVNYFARVFKKAVGISPTKYRQSKQN